MNDDGEPLFTRKLSHGQLLALDALAAAGYTLVLIGMVTAQASAADVASPVPFWAPYLVVLAMGLPLATRRRWPVPVFAVVFGASLASLLLGIVRDGFVGAGFAAYIVALAERRPRREPTLLIGALSVVGIVALVVAGGPAPLVADVGPIVVGAVVLSGSWTIGRAVRERRRFAVRSAAGLVQRAVSAERLRIARDLHDVVAHGLSVIVVKAATANHVMSVHPEEAEDALRVIETTGRAALLEMRGMLDVLRTEGSGGEDLDLAPAPNLGQLPALAERVALAGVRVDFDVRGIAELPEGVALSVYRIVQEALTNVVKHAAPAQCRITIAAAGGEVRVEIVDDGLRAGLTLDLSGVGPGHGLIGMRERVRMLGGEFDAGPLAQRGFRVVARIPYGPLVRPAGEPS